MSAYQDAGYVNAGEPSPADQDIVSQSEMTAIKEDKLELLGHALAKTRDEWIDARVAAEVDKRWLEDLDQYLGKDDATKRGSSMMDQVQAGGYPVRSEETKVQRSTVFVNITRPKTNAVEARLANMLYPTDDLCWGIKATPDPKLSKLAQMEAKAVGASTPAQGAPQAASNLAAPTMPQNPGTPGGIQPASTGPSLGSEMGQAPMPGAIASAFPQGGAKDKLDEAASRAKAMQNKIYDAHVECDFQAEARKMLHNCAVLGTGILKGPIVVNRTSKVWQKISNDTYALELVKDTKPVSVSVDPWRCYPDPSCGDNVHNGKGIFEEVHYTEKQLRELVGQPGYITGQIAKVLREGPKRITKTNQRDMREDSPRKNENLYQAWEYWGMFSPDDLRLCGVEVPDDSPEIISGCVIMVNDTVIKGFLNPLECQSLPYDFMPFEKADNSPWGYGVPFLCRPAQRVLNAAWRQMMDNAGMSVGPNIVLKPDTITPADGKWQVTGNKVWNCTDLGADVRQAFGVFEFPNHTEQFQVIIELALRFADEETSVPKITQGNAEQSDSVGVTTIQMNSSNVVLGRLAKQHDDYLIKPHIRRYYDFFMAYDEDAEIKGDFQVDARGSSVLLLRDLQSQAILQFGQFQGSSIVSPMVRWQNWVKEWLKSQHLEKTDLLKTDEEIEAVINQPPGPSPDQLKAEAAKEVAQIRANATLTTAQAREQGELAFANAQAQMARDNHIAKIKELELQRDLEILKYSIQQKTTLEQTKADLAKTHVIEQTKRQIAAAKIQADALEGDKSRLHQPSQPSQPTGATNG